MYRLTTMLKSVEFRVLFFLAAFMSLSWMVLTRRADVTSHGVYIHFFLTWILVIAGLFLLQHVHGTKKRANSTESPTSGKE